ncbi:MAG: DUF1566 domain-containing protein [Bacteroidetes bacterium]|nr:DUF1566 domain-containing protein [Bacteroidota bacterium]
MKNILCVVFLLFGMNLYSQVAINSEGSAPDNSAMLDIKSNTKGILVPRMTAAERDAIINPATGLMIFCKDDNQFYAVKQSGQTQSWVSLGSQWLSNGSSVYYTAGNVGMGTSAPFGALHIVNPGYPHLNLEGSSIYGTWVSLGNTTAGGTWYNIISTGSGNGEGPGKLLFMRGAGPSNTLNNIMTFDTPGNVGIGTTSPNASAVLDASSSNKGFLPPRMSNEQRDAIAAPVAGLMIWCSNCGPSGQLQVYNGTTWTNMVGGTALVHVLVPGESYGGGLIAYVLQSGDPGYDANVQHGLIVAPSDQPFVYVWGCIGSSINGADGTALGTGNQNTLDIVAGCSEPNMAATTCENLVLNGYSDWYLPSKDELNKVYLNKAVLGVFDNFGYYASSTEIDQTFAWGQYWNTGAQYYMPKNISFNVRAVRTF